VSTTSIPREATDVAARVRKPALEVQDLGVDLDGAAILAGVSFAVPAGGWVGLVGPNGSGKTTTLRAILGLAPWSLGMVKLAGRPTHSLRPRERAKAVAYVPQAPMIPLSMTVRDYVLLGRNPHIGFFSVESADDLALVQMTLARLDLEGLDGRAVGSLSGGERRRVVLARALAQEAPLLLLDEPTAELDLGHAQEVLELVDELRRTSGLTVVSAIHDLTLASQFTDSLVMLVRGRVAAAGSAPEVLTVERLARHYRATVEVEPASPGATGLVIRPVRRLAPPG
jgi:iron complex transport system ATP-binding protein